MKTIDLKKYYHDPELYDESNLVVVTDEVAGTMSKLESPAEKKTEHEITIEVEKVVLPQVVSIKKASELMGLPAYYLRRLCKEVPGLAFQSGVKWYINLGKLAEYYNNIQDKSS